MVFIRKVPGRAGAVKIQIAQRRARRDVVLENVGTAHDDAELAVLMATAQARLVIGQGQLPLGLAADGSPQRPGVITSKSSTLLWQALTSGYAALGFDAVGDAAFMQMVLARLVEPASKADSLRVLDELGVPHVSLRTLFRSLGRCSGRDYRDRLSGLCVQYATARAALTLVLYDATTLYFEVEKEDDLRKVGYSKERRVDPQIVVGLLVDRDGFPLDVHCFEGNIAETTTIVPIVKAFQARHQVTDMVVVADAGMLSAANLKDLDEQGVRFIVGSRVTKAPVDLESHFRWHGEAFADGQVIDTLTPRAATAAARAENDVNKRAEPVWDRQTHPLSWRAVWAYTTKRALRDRKTLQLQEDKARAVVAGQKPARTPRFVRAGKDGHVLDEVSLARARRLVGLKGYVTNIDATVMPADEIISSYHDLWHVEQSFRMSKSDLRARPVFHHKKDAIQAHLTVVFAALAVAWHLQHVTGHSIRKIVHTLRPLQQITLTIAGHQHTAADPITPTAKTILDALQIPTA